MQIIENENGTFKLTAENESENRLVASIVDILWAGDYSEEILNAHGLIEIKSGGKTEYRNYVTVPEGVLPEVEADENPYLLSGDELQKTVDFRVAGH